MIYFALKSLSKLILNKWHFEYYLKEMWIIWLGFGLKQKFEIFIVDIRN